MVHNILMAKLRETKSSKHLVYSCQYHVVWCTKYRRSVLNEAVEERLKALIKGM